MDALYRGVGFNGGYGPDSREFECLGNSAEVGVNLLLQPSDKDTILWSGGPNNNYGSLARINLHDRETIASTTGSERILIAFDISAIPVGSEILAAALAIYYDAYATPAPDADPAGKILRAYKCTRTDWVESEATWNSYKSGNSWTDAGGDYVTSGPEGASLTVPSSIDVWLNFDVTAIVQNAVDALSNAHFIIKFETEGLTTNTGYILSHSSDYATNTALRPKMLISYRPRGMGKVHVLGGGP